MTLLILGCLIAEENPLPMRIVDLVGWFEVCDFYRAAWTASVSVTAHLEWNVVVRIDRRLSRNRWVTNGSVSHPWRKSAQLLALTPDWPVE